MRCLPWLVRKYYFPAASKACDGHDKEIDRTRMAGTARPGITSNQWWKHARAVDSIASNRLDKNPRDLNVWPFVVPSAIPWSFQPSQREHMIAAYI
jgi:hypothetical protein